MDASLRSGRAPETTDHETTTDPVSALTRAPPLSTWMKSERKVHPLLSALIPPMPPDQLEALIDQVRRTGRMPGAIRVWRGQLVDGRALVHCADKLRLPIEEIDISDMQERTLLDFILERNLYRRHLSTGQRALMAIEASHRAVVMGLKHITCERAAACSGVSPSSLHSLQHAIKLVPELIESVRAGTISIHGANEACNAMIDWPATARADLAKRLLALDRAEAAKLVRSLRSRPPAGSAPAKTVATACAADAVVADDAVEEQDAAPAAASASPAARAALASEQKPITARFEAEPDALAGSDAGHGPLLAALESIQELHDLLRQLSARLTRDPPAGGAPSDVAAAIRAALEIDLPGLQRALIEVERLLDEHAFRNG